MKDYPLDDSIENVEGKNLSVDDLRRIIANPFYAVEIHESMCTPHETMISEETWIKAAARSMEEEGPEQFLQNLLENLKGNYI